MPIRDKGFTIVLKDFPSNEVEQLMNFHRQNGGLSRYVKFRHFFENIKQESISDNEIQNWADKFSEIMLQELINPDLLISDTINFVKRSYTHYKMHIVSGSDGNELKKICKGINIDKYFISIEGSPSPKKTLVEEIIKKYGYDKNNCVLIGDSINDKEAALVNGITFRGYNNSKLKDLYYIESFKDLKL
ncbi:MAG: HAD-IA family hydrolase [Chitinophagales bacterium]|nr:HAD-IA family hydrolase [Chitinophagales bacterium]